MSDVAINLKNLEIYAAQAEVAEWRGHECLRLENGLAVVPDLKLKNAVIDVAICTEGPAYPGVAFRISDILNYELVYAVPHVSGQWDAMQYDPVFHGSNTWQIYSGTPFQQAAQIPAGEWFHLQVAFHNETVIAGIDGQPPLVVLNPARLRKVGKLGLWTYHPAYFRDLKILPGQAMKPPPGTSPQMPEHAISEWFIQGFGAVGCEANGVLNLNRHLPLSLQKVTLVRRFVLLEDTSVELNVGFSDLLELKIDGKLIFKGENRFRGFGDYRSRGYVESPGETILRQLSAGRHVIHADLSVQEGFGWGLLMTIQGKSLSLLPVETG